MDNNETHHKHSLNFENISNDGTEDAVTASNGAQAVLPMPAVPFKKQKHDKTSVHSPSMSADDRNDTPSELLRPDNSTTPNEIATFEQTKTNVSVVPTQNSYSIGLNQDMASNDKSLKDDYAWADYITIGDEILPKSPTVPLKEPLPSAAFPPQTSPLAREPSQLPRSNKEKKLIEGEQSVADIVDDSTDALILQGMACSIPSICAGCEAALHDLNSRARILRMFDEIVPRADTSNTYISPPGHLRDTCCEQTCYGCNMDCSPSTATTNLSNNTLQIGKQYEAIYHCSKGRLLRMFILLCGFDEKSSFNTISSSKQRTNLTQRTQPSHLMSSFQSTGTILPNGVGYEQDNGGGFGGWDLNALFPFVGPFADGPSKANRGRAALGSSSLATTRQAIAELADEEDRMTACVMQGLSVLLGDLEFDEEEHSSILRVMLKKSSLLDRLDILLDVSPSEILRKEALYEKLGIFVRTLASHESTRDLLSSKRILRTPGHNIMKLILEEPTLTDGEREQTAPSLIASLYRQSGRIEEAFRIQAQHRRRYEIENFPILAEISGLTSFVKEQCNPEPAAIAGGLEPLGARYFDRFAWQIALQVQMIDDSVLSENFTCRDLKHESGTSTLAANRMKHIKKEICLLKGAGNLPENIFIRYADSQPGRIKVLIIGPMGTPYENGAFEFDLLCPAKFPQEPPIMLFKTTERGAIRFNPNLYANGKVCLSLINTWSQDQWIPNSSTILQIVISIQAMIFTEQPYCNEPGYEGEADTAESKQYNRTIYVRTVKAAMLPWLERRHGSSLWQDVLDKHFEVNEEQILKTMDVWTGCDGKSQDDGASREKGVAAPSHLVDKLRKALAALRANVVGSRVKFASELLDELDDQSEAK